MDGPRPLMRAFRGIRMPVLPARTISSALLGAVSLIALASTAASAEDFDASRLPRPANAKIVFSGAPVANFTVPGKVADAADAINKLMLADHWQTYVAPFSSNPKLPNFMVTRFKRGSIAMEVDVSVAPAMSNATYVAYTGLVNESDLPFPPDATDIQFDSALPYLACITSAGIDDTLKFFTTELATRGWTPRPENARPDRKGDKGAYATFTASENRGLFLTLKRGDDSRLNVEIRAIAADEIGAKPDEIATVAPLPLSPEQLAEAEAAKNRARMEQAKRDEAKAEADAIVAKAQQIARDTIAQANKDAEAIKDTAQASAPKAAASSAADSPPQPAASSAPPIPMPNGAEDIDYNAADGKLEFNSASSVKALAAFYRSSLKALGWKEDPTPINKPNMVALEFAKGDKDLSFTIMQLGNSVNVDVNGSGLVTAAAKPDSDDAHSQGKGDDRITSADQLEAEESGGLPVPTEHTISEGDQSPFRHQLHASIPASLDAVLGFYRRELTKRGWKEDAQGASIKPDQASVPFTSPTGPSVLKLARKDGETTVELAVRDTDAAAKAGMLPKAGQVKLLLGNTLPAAAIFTINNRTIKVPAGAGTKSPASGPQLELPPGAYKFSLKIPGKPAASDQLTVAADETWGLLIGPGGALPLQMY
jgi:hypothetical protein